MATARTKPRKWVPPDDLDPECLDLCIALNKIPGIETGCSCCGHGKSSYNIFLRAKSLKYLPFMLYYFDVCHSGASGWEVIARTDCAMSPVIFWVRGPNGPKSYADSKDIAKLITKNLRGYIP